jgi:hypothetical protein
LWLHLCGSASTACCCTICQLNDTAPKTIILFFSFRLYLDWLCLLRGVSTHSQTCPSWLCCLEANKRYVNPFCVVLENLFWIPCLAGSAKIFYVCFQTFPRIRNAAPQNRVFFEFAYSALLVLCRALVAIIWPLHSFISWLSALIRLRTAASIN